MLSKHTIRNVALLMATLICALAAPNSAATKPRANHVVVISFDQGGGQELKKAANMPVLQSMARAGARTWDAYTIVPSITLPSHVSMLTGVGIQKHQIDWNDYRPDAGVVKVSTIFSIAKSRGLSTAMYAGKEKFKHLNLPGSLNHFEISGGALKVADAFARDMPKTKYNLTFLHFADIDSKGHAFGLYSPEWKQALADTNQALGIVYKTLLKAGLNTDSVLILTADHGGHNITNSAGELRGTHGTSKPEDVEIPWIAWGRGVKANSDITAPVVTYDTSATALWLLGVDVPEGFWGRPVVSAFAP